MSTRKRLRSNEIALIGVVLLACGIAVLAGGAGLPDRWPAAAGLWASALMAFAVARHTSRR